MCSRTHAALCGNINTLLTEIASMLPPHETQIHDRLINMFFKVIIPEKLNLIDAKLN